MRGHVKIASEQDALQYVRLRTTPSTWILWHDKQFEIVTDRMARALPTYRSPCGFGWNAAASSGYLGVLSDAAFAQGHFTSPTTLRSGRGFVVYRWVYCGKDVQFVRETIGPDGSYWQYIVREMAPPRLPNTKWRFPLIE